MPNPEFTEEWPPRFNPNKSRESGGRQSSGWERWDTMGSSTKTQKPTTFTSQEPLDIKLCWSEDGSRPLTLNEIATRLSSSSSTAPARGPTPTRGVAKRRKRGGKAKSTIPDSYHKLKGEEQGQAAKLWLKIPARPRASQRDREEKEEEEEEEKEETPDTEYFDLRNPVQKQGFQEKKQYSKGVEETPGPYAIHAPTHRSEAVRQWLDLPDFYQEGEEEPYRLKKKKDSKSKAVPMEIDEDSDS